MDEAAVFRDGHEWAISVSLQSYHCIYFTVRQLIVEVELPRATEDIFGDDSCQVRLDAKEFLSEVGVLDFRQAFGPQLEMRWQRKLLLVPY